MSEIKPAIIIEDTEEFFPNRFLTKEERLLLVAKIIKHTSTSIADTLPPEIRLEAKLADSNIINRLIQNCSEEETKLLMINIGAMIRIYVTKRPEILGLISTEKSKNLVN